MTISNSIAKTKVSVEIANPVDEPYFMFITSAGEIIMYWMDATNLVFYDFPTPTNTGLSFSEFAYSAEDQGGIIVG